MFDSIIVGSGFAGAVFARQMAEAGKRVLILEKRAHIGGNMFEYRSQNGIRVHKYGPHIFHTNKKEVFDYVQKFSDWYPYRHKVLGKINNTYVPIPFNFTSIEKLFSPSKTYTLLSELTKCYAMGSKVSIFDLLQNPNETIHTFGKYVFHKVFVNYTAKQWGVPIHLIHPSTLTRVPIVIGYDPHYFSDEYQFMPKKGYPFLFQTMLHHPNITIQLNTNAMQRISLDVSTSTVFIDDRKFTGHLLYSGAIDELCAYKFGPLPYRTLDLKFENHAQDFFQQNAIINYPNEETFTRITEFKYITGQVATMQTTILKEYPLAHTCANHLEPYYPINNKSNTALYQQYIHFLRPFTNILLCGRLAQYSYYNMDTVILNALQLAEKVLRNDE